MQFNNSRYTQILHGILIVLLTGVLALAVLTQANPGLTLPDRDYGDRAYTGQQILLGKLPYKDISLGKPPAIYYLNALGLWAAHGLRWGIWAIEFICLAASILLSYILIKKLWGVFPALCGILIWTYGLNITMGGGNNTEEFPLPLHFLSLILFLNLIKSPRNYLNNLLVGLAFGISFLFRENNAAIETAIVLVLLIIQLGRKDFRTIFTQLIWMAAGVLIPVLITITYFWSQGIVKQMYGGSVTAPLTYSETKFSGLPAGLGGFQVLGIVGWISLIGFSIALILWIRHRRDESSALLLLLVIGFPLTVVTSDVAQRSYPHYFINWLPFVALLSGLTFYVIQNKLTSYLKSTAGADLFYAGFALVIAAFFFIQSGQAAENWMSFANLLNRSDVERNSIISAYVENYTEPGDLVLFWGGFPGENFMAHRASPNSSQYPLMTEGASERASDQFLLDLTNDRPALIVDMDYTKALSLDPKKRAAEFAAHEEWPYLPADIDEVFNFIDNNYHLEATFKNATVYRLNNDSP
ncbi:MAG: glycosyltransferase family 39 protein [Anaerolineales bacterium]